MAKQNAQATLQKKVDQYKNFLNYMVAYFKKNNPIRNMIEGMVTYVRDLTTVQQKIKKIQYRVNYERYKLKKTELILAQNSEHVFLKGRSLNQTR